MPRVPARFSGKSPLQHVYHRPRLLLAIAVSVALLCTWVYIGSCVLMKEPAVKQKPAPRTTAAVALPPPPRPPMRHDTPAAKCVHATPRFCVVVLAPAGNPMFHAFDDIVTTLADSVSNLGGITRVRVAYHDVKWDEVCLEDGRDATTHLVLGANLLHGMPEYENTPPPPAHWAVYNLEQVGNTVWFQGKAFDLLRTHPVWDYSAKNARSLVMRGIHPLVVPTGYSPSLTHLAEPNEQEQYLDVLLVGSCHPRRCTVMQQFKKRGLNVAMVGDVCFGGMCSDLLLPMAFGKERDELLSRAKVVINIHYFEAAVFEAARVSYLLANHVFVVSERGRDAELEAPYHGGVVFAEYDDLVGTVEMYLASSSKRAAVAERGFQLVQTMRLEPFVRCPVFGVPSHRQPRVPGEPRWLVTGGALDDTKAGLKGDSKLRGAATPQQSMDDKQVFDAHIGAFASDPRLQPPPEFQVTAIMAGFNEGDVIRSSITDYLEQGISVHYIDNWSTDNTADTIKRIQAELEQRWARPDGRAVFRPTHDGHESPPQVPLPATLTLTYERFPDTQPTTYNWEEILMRKEQVSTELARTTWALHVDADEIRESPWGRAVPLRQGLYVAHIMGYNFVNFNNLIVFRPVDLSEFDGEAHDMRHFFQYFDQNGNNADATRQLKGWRRVPVSTGHISFHKSGGHDSKFAVSPADLQRVFPWSFVLRHYPVRSQKHGMRKVVKERMGRWNPAERQAGWHTQYDQIATSDQSGSGSGRGDAVPEHMFINFVKDRTKLVHAPGGVLPRSVYTSELPCPSVTLPHGGSEAVVAWSDM